MSSTPNRESIREWYPSLKSGFAFLENAGGSQVPANVINAISEYLTETYVQLGAGYPQSVRATSVVEEAHAFMRTFMNADGVGEVVLGPSTTALCHILAHAYEQVIQPGDEIIVAETNHEANAGPWFKLADTHGAEVRIWKVDPQTFECPLDTLAELVGERTRLVALPHVSNLLGQEADLESVVQIAHSVGAKVVADGVAYAPHRAIDVARTGVDWYVFSNYKVYGPHAAVLFGTHGAFAELEGPNHFFIPRGDVVHKFELGSLSHESCAGIVALQAYFRFLAGRTEDDRETIVKAYHNIAALDAPLEAQLLEFLRTKPVRIVGSCGGRTVGTVSFVHDSVPSPKIVEEVDRASIGIRYGHMYAYRLVRALGIDPATGVVRVSPVHYNTPEEIARLIEVLDRVL